MTDRCSFYTIRAVEQTLAIAPDARARSLRLPFPLLAGISLSKTGDMGKSGERSRSERECFLREFGVKAQSCLTVRQVHSRTIVLLDGGVTSLADEARTRTVPAPGAFAGGAAEEPGAAAEGAEDIAADGLLCVRRRSSEGSIMAPAAGRAGALGVTVADCLPLFLFDHETGSFGLLHSGWRGTGILSRALSILTEHNGGLAQQVELLIGPGIGSCCYEVDEMRARGFSESFGDATVRREAGRHYLDLGRANLDMARTWGVGTIRYFKSCTHCNPAYHSYRRDGAERYAHMLAFCVAA